MNEKRKHLLRCFPAALAGVVPCPPPGPVLLDRVSPTPAVLGVTFSCERGSDEALTFHPDDGIDGIASERAEYLHATALRHCYRACGDLPLNLGVDVNPGGVTVRAQLIGSDTCVEAGIRYVHSATAGIKVKEMLNICIRFGQNNVNIAE